MKLDEQDRILVHVLKHRKYKFSIIDNNKLQFINTCLGGTFATKSLCHPGLIFSKERNVITDASQFIV
jgi:hypothetical protein